MTIWPFFTDVNQHLEGKSPLSNSKNDTSVDVVVVTVTQDEI